MSVRGTIFFAIMVIGAVVNFASGKICEKYFTENSMAIQLRLKLAGLALVIIGVVLLMIFGK